MERVREPSRCRRVAVARLLQEVGDCGVAVEHVHGELFVRLAVPVGAARGDEHMRVVGGRESAQKRGAFRIVIDEEPGLPGAHLRELVHGF